ncbi:MAG TPA: tRNA (adenosine(37)-N6)-threonylcarbamoyltransferase complex dimerization subunit type 1 TsaB [Candidatus Hydrogenedentes bacterium]|nr:tRNA (adenosine(37)-N6)-threonylcarbamoyltransferase complex dimerization subunit type 1 TsaB [Candidatus Hydrogenedentota bacterium]
MTTSISPASTILAVDTSTGWCAVGVCRVEAAPSSPSIRICSEVVVDGGRLHAERLFSLIDHVLCDSGVALEALSLLAVTTGPGSFTGLRIGVSAMQGLALARGLPLVGVPTLDALVHAAAPADGLVVPLLDARMGEVFGAFYRMTAAGPEKLGEDRVGPVGRLLEQMPSGGEAAVFIGDGADRYAAEIRSALPNVRIVPPPGNTPRASFVALEAARRRAAGAPTDPAQAVPVYLRKAQAEIPRGGKP